MGATTAIGVGAGVMAAASLYGASQQSSATQSAAQMEAAASGSAAQLQYLSSEDALKLQQQEFQTNQANLQPWLQQGQQSLSTLGQLMQLGGQLANTGYTQQQFQSSPLYQTMQQQQTLGVDQLAAQSAAGGMFGSGSMGTALTNYAQQMAGTYEPAAYAQYQDQNNTLYNRLAGLAGTGQQTASTLGQLGSNYANTASQTGMYGASALAQGQIGTANALAGGQLGQGNIWANYLSGVGNQAMGGLGSYLNYQQNQNLINTLGGNQGNQGNWLDEWTSGGY